MSQPAASPSPRDHDLDEAVTALASRGDHPGVVRLVEAWTAQGTPTARARLEEARAFFALRLMDRALNRTREVLEAEPDNAEALLLQAEIYLERGWPLKARRPLQVLQEQGGHDLEALRARANAEPVRPEATAREVEREGNPVRLLALAEGFIATGSFLRATGILERLRRTDPDNARIKELLWGLAGDFGGQSLDALVAAARPAGPPALRDAHPEEPEHTESLDLRAADLDPEEGAGANFPALFKYVPSAGSLGAEDPQEATQSSGLASPEEMAAPGNRENTDPGVRLRSITQADSGDTQIMLVLRPGEERPAATHRRKEEGPSALRETLNLRAWQQSMGMGAAASDLSDAPDDLLEEEDENVVVVTRGESAPAEQAPASFSTPIEVIEKHAVPIVAPAPEPAPAPPEPPLAPARPRSIPRVALGAAAVLVGGMLFLAALAVGGLASRGGASSSLRDELVGALAAEDYNALLTQEGRLEQRAAAGERASEVAEVRAALTEARLVLWSDFNGDPTRIAKVREGLSSPQIGLHRLALLRASEALAREDVSGATAALGRERPEDDEELLLFARIAACGGDRDRALAYFDQMRAGERPRYRLARAEILAASGDRAGARAIVADVLRNSPNHPAARTLELELSDAPPADVAAAVEKFLGEQAVPLPPRLEGRLRALSARAFLALGARDRANDAIEQGIHRDGANPDLLLLSAANLADQQRLTEALHEVSDVVATRPGSGDAQTAYVLLLLDLDRAEEANDAVLKLEAASMLPALTPVLETVVTVVGMQDRPTTALTPPQILTPLGSYAAAMLAVQERSPDALATIEAAVATTKASPDPFVKRLAARLSAVRAIVAGPPEGDAYATESLAAAADDPAVHVFLGRYYELAGKKALAAQHFDRAAQLGPELGMAWYEKGRFYLDARDGYTRSNAAWRNFLALAPSGPRAARARDTLGVP